MSQRRRGTLDDVYQILLITPWWAGPLLAGAAFGFFWGLSLFIQDSGTVVGPALGSGLRFFAPVAAGLVLMVWVWSLLTKSERRALFNKQRDIETIRELSWREFEWLVGEAFRRQGYTVTEHGGAGADGGIDLELHRGGERWLVQCKHWKSKSVGVEPVRALYGVVAAEKATGGYFVTTGTFTRPARVFAKPNLKLIDGGELWSMVQGINMGHAQPGSVGHEAEAGIAQSEEPGAAADSPACPRCGSPMIVKTAKRGANAGLQFYACPRFPACRGTRSIEY